MPEIDLNSDLGEGYGVWRLGDDDALLEIVTSANVACGFHGGDPSTMRSVCRQASTRGVAIGAQVSYPDLAGFGRRFLDIDPDELTDVVAYQIGGLEAIARVEGARVRYVKPHGALYHACVGHEGQAGAVVRAVAQLDPELAVLGAPGSLLLELAEAAGLRVVREAFADRGYRPDGTLVPRGEPGALLHDVALVSARAVRLATEGTVEAVDGTVVEVHAQSVCVHGDTPGAVAMATSVRAGLEGAGVRVAPFVEQN